LVKKSAIQKHPEKLKGSISLCTLCETSASFAVKKSSIKQKTKRQQLLSRPLADRFAVTKNLYSKK